MCIEYCGMLAITLSDSMGNYRQYTHAIDIEYIVATVCIMRAMSPIQIPLNNVFDSYLHTVATVSRVLSHVDS